MPGTFATVLKRAADRKGGEKALRANLPKVLQSSELAKRGDHEFLAAMTRCIFQAGFAWKVIEAKWPGFEEAFLGFSPVALNALAEDAWTAYKSDTRIVKNGPKIKTVRVNASMVQAVSVEHDGFGRYLADWPTSDLVGLFADLKRRGSHLGGVTGQRFLQAVGKDSFALSKDVVACLKHEGLEIADTPASKRDLKAIQDTFNAWHDESGLPYRHLSAIMARSIGENYSM
ncbi:MAG: DNA-3-methyladenine glycosylase I [Gammaproteobacteria bacterium]|nr:DNA-3-methyladenine glycosylase I [Gammaproteobacteria bacterium]